MRVRKIVQNFGGHLMNLVQLCTVLQTFWARVYISYLTAMKQLSVYFHCLDVKPLKIDSTKNHLNQFTMFIPYSRVPNNCDSGIIATRCKSRQKLNATRCKVPNNCDRLLFSRNIKCDAMHRVPNNCDALYRK